MKSFMNSKYNKFISTYYNIILLQIWFKKSVELFTTFNIIMFTPFYKLKGYDIYINDNLNQKVITITYMVTI